MPIDFSLLSREELEEELKVRGIIARGIEGTKALSHYVTEEQLGRRANPLPLPSVRLNNEMAECRNKFESLKVSVEEMVDARKDITDSAPLVRLWHLESKVARLCAAYPGTESVLTIQKDIQSLISHLSPQSPDPILEDVEELPANTTSGSRDPEFRGFTTPAANVLNDFINNSMRGARKKTSQTGGIPTARGFNSGQPPPNNSNATGTSNTSAFRPHRTFNVGNGNGPPNAANAQRVPIVAAQQIHADPINQRVHVPVLGLPPRFNLGHVMSKWPVRFPGSTKVPIDEFIFRVENLAVADNIPLPSLMIGLHFLLEKGPSDFYWNYLRKNHEATWDQVRAALLERYATLDSDVEIRKAIADRRQIPGEDFGEFSLAIENLANRLRRPMDEGEIIDYLRQNMSHRLQTALMLHPTYTIRELQAHSRRFEKLWEVQSLSLRRPVGRVHELEKSFNNFQLQDTGAVPVHPVLAHNEFAGYTAATSNPVYDPTRVVEAFRPHPPPPQVAPNPNRGEYLVCWNCQDIGHTFIDCVATRTVFCYGCGAKNVYKPQCAACNSGNSRRGGSGSGRPNPFTVLKKEDNHQ